MKKSIYLLLIILTLVSCARTKHVVHAEKPKKPTGTIKQVALLIPQQGSLAGPGNAIHDGWQAAEKRNETSIQLKVYDTKQSDIISLYQKAKKEGADLIVGPLDKPSVQRLIQYSDLSRPVISLNQTELYNDRVYQFGLSPQDEAIKVAERAYKDGYRAAMMIIPQDSWGDKIADEFAKAWEKQGGEILQRQRYSASTDWNQVMQLMAHVNLSSEPIVLFMVAYPKTTQQILSQLKLNRVEHVQPYTLSISYNGSNSTELDNVTFCDMPWMFGQGRTIQQEYTNQNGSWSPSYNIYSRLYALGYDAHQLATQFKRLRQHKSIYGATGVLSLGDQNIIHRELECARIENGIVKSS